MRSGLLRERDEPTRRAITEVIVRTEVDDRRADLVERHRTLAQKAPPLEVCQLLA
jgi:hypothetical protein